MSDWLGLIFIVLLLAGGLFGLSHLGKPQPEMSAEEFERRAAEARGITRSGAAAAMYALQKLMNPRAAEAVEVQKDLRAGFYDDQQKKGDGDDGEEDGDDGDETEARSGEDAQARSDAEAEEEGRRGVEAKETGETEG